MGSLVMEQRQMHCNGQTIKAVVTSDPDVITAWIVLVRRTYYYKIRAKALVVGLCIQWRLKPNLLEPSPVATLQLCTGVHCLIIQILHAAAAGPLPPKLFSFLADPRHIFVGLGVEQDARKLLKDCNLVVKRVLDLRDLVAAKLNDPDVKKMGLGLKNLERRLYGYELEKPRHHRTLCYWDNEKLSMEQVEYACKKASVSYQIAWVCRAGSYSCAKPDEEHLLVSMGELGKALVRCLLLKRKTIWDYIKKQQ